MKKISDLQLELGLKVKPMSKKRALAVYVYNATLGNEEKKHVWANEETFDRLTLRRDARPSGKAARSWKASLNKRERRNRELHEDREPRYLQG